MGLTLLTAPAEEPVSLSEAKTHLRVEHTDDDVLITGLIAAARQAAEARTGRALVTQKWRQTLDAWPDDGVIELDKPRLISVESVSYLAIDGTRQTLDPAAYQAVTDTLIGTVQPTYGTYWPPCRDTPGSLRVDYTAGYGNAAAVPQPIKGWMLLALATWYAQREALVAGVSLAELPRAVWGSLLDPYIVMGL
ncbi:MAG: head-tail connector protein [Chloroflexota bacterium]